MARKTRRRGKGGKRVRGTRRVIRVRRGRISRGGNRRYNNEGGISLDEALASAKNMGAQALAEAKEFGSQATAFGSQAMIRAREIASQRLA